MEPRTSLVPVQGGLSLSAPGAPDGAVVDSLKSLMVALMVSERGVADEGQRTASRFERFMVAMQARVVALSTETLALHKKLVDGKSRQREIALLQKEELATAQRGLEEARKDVEILRREMMEAVQKADACVAQALAAKAETVRAATEAGEARVAIAQQEAAAAQQLLEATRQKIAQHTADADAKEKAAVRALTQSFDGPCSYFEHEAEIMRQRIERAKVLAAEHERRQLLALPPPNSAICLYLAKIYLGGQKLSIFQSRYKP